MTANRDLKDLRHLQKLPICGFNATQHIGIDTGRIHQERDEDCQILRGKQISARMIKDATGTDLTANMAGANSSRIL